MGSTRIHPEFAAVREGSKDPGGIKLNHYLHMQSLLGRTMRACIACEDCHPIQAGKGRVAQRGSQS